MSDLMPLTNSICPLFVRLYSLSIETCFTNSPPLKCLFLHKCIFQEGGGGRVKGRYLSILIDCLLSLQFLIEIICIKRHVSVHQTDMTVYFLCFFDQYM